MQHVVNIIVSTSVTIIDIWWFFWKLDSTMRMNVSGYLTKILPKSSLNSGVLILNCGKISLMNTKVSLLIRAKRWWLTIGTQQTTIIEMILSSQLNFLILNSSQNIPMILLIRCSKKFRAAIPTKLTRKKDGSEVNLNIQRKGCWMVQSFSFPMKIL